MTCTWTRTIAISNSTAKRCCAMPCGVMVNSSLSNSHTVCSVNFPQVRMMSPIHSGRVYTTTNNDSANRIRTRILAGLGRTLTTTESNTWNARFCELNDRFSSRLYANTRFQSYVLVILPENRFVSG